MPSDPHSILNREKRLVLLSFCVLIAVPIALFWPALAGHQLLYGYDTIALGLPFHAEVLRSLAAHQWPLWFPDVLGGMPGLASCNLLFAYPTDCIGSLFGLSLQALLGLDAAVHVALAGIGMFLFLRRLGRSASACLLGGLFFALSGSLVSQIYGGYFNFVEGVAVVPWAFWAAHKGREDGDWFAWGLCGLVFALQILAGAAQLCVYTVAAVALFILAAPRNPAGASPPPRFAGTGPAGRLHALQGLGLSLGLAVLLAAPQLWLTLQYLPLSMRSHGWTYSQFLDGSIAGSEALTWLVPGSFGWQMPTYHGAMADCFTSEYFGLLPWALAFAALASLWRRERIVRWMAILALCAFFFAQRDWVPFYGVFHRVPVLSGFRIWCRVLFLLTFAFCVLAAYGWDALRSQRTRSAALLGTLAFMVLALACAAFCWHGARATAAAASLPAFGVGATSEGMLETLTALTRNSARTTLSFLPFVAVLLWLGTKRWNAAVLLALALAFHCVDQYQMMGRFVQFMDPRAGVASPRYTLAPPPPAGAEPWRIYDDDVAHPNNNIFLGYENLEGRESLLLNSYDRIRQAMQGRGKDWIDLMNERYLFVHGSEDRVTIYQNHDAFPRAWLVGRSVRVADDEQAYRLLADPSFRPRDVVALPLDPRLAPEPGPAARPPQGSVLWLDRSPQTASLDVSTDRDAVLVLSNAWYPSWRCRVDGRDTPVLKADGGLQAVVVRAGRHAVDFRFDNSLFYDALAACLAGLAALVGLACL